MKRATTIDEQIALLESRGVIIEDKTKAKEILEDIGFYRLGFYSFPFEKTFPEPNNRDHKCSDDTSLDDIIELYYFDCDLRRILTKFLDRIEVNIRTYITYICSNTYSKDPYWFISPSCVKSDYISGFEESVYKTIRKNPVIKRHHLKYRNDRFAPAWKVLEFMTLGNICSLYSNLKDENLRLLIAQHYGCRLDEFINYLDTIRVVRNSCAHGSCIYSIKLSKGIIKGPAGNPALTGNRHSIRGAISIVSYILRYISTNRNQEMIDDISELIKLIKSQNVRGVVKKCTGFDSDNFVV